MKLPTATTSFLQHACAAVHTTLPQTKEAPSGRVAAAAACCKRMKSAAKQLPHTTMTAAHPNAVMDQPNPAQPKQGLTSACRTSAGAPAALPTYTPSPSAARSDSSGLNTPFTSTTLLPAASGTASCSSCWLLTAASAGAMARVELSSGLMSVYLYSSLRVLGMRRVGRTDWQLLRRADTADGTLQTQRTGQRK